MMNGFSGTQMLISEKNPFLMVNFMYSFLEVFQNEKKKRSKSPHKVTTSHNGKCNDVN